MKKNKKKMSIVFEDDLEPRKKGKEAKTKDKKKKKDCEGKKKSKKSGSLADAPISKKKKKMSLKKKELEETAGNRDKENGQKQKSAETQDSKANKKKTRQPAKDSRGLFPLTVKLQDMEKIEVGSENFWRQQCKARLIDYVKIGGGYHIIYADICRWLDENTVKNIRGQKKSSN